MDMMPIEMFQSGDGSLDFMEIAEKYGFAVDRYLVTTEDDYILTLFRIPGLLGHDEDIDRADDKPPVLLMHGLIDSADSWILNEEDVAPGFVLAR